jgi:carbamoyl-phosphate synthase large subunit
MNQTDPRIKKVLVLGSGGLKIGQAGEFDYSGSQALKALREEGVATALINPNIATIQTSEGMADATYFLPVTPEFVTKVIEKEKPDGILLSFGGQTALNCGVALDRAGALAKHGVRVLGTPVKTIEDTEDRALFVKRLDEIGVLSPRGIAASNTAATVRAAAEIGYPVMVRAAYALGGSGSGACRNEAELRKRCDKAFAQSGGMGIGGSLPQVLIEEWLGGWKEIEYEVVRDGADNCVTVCNMENVDPLGVHTGESIVVAPSQTLNDREYHKLRRIAIAVIRRLGIVGECNIQYALDPRSEDYRVIEVNARLSRSSALASKATGYPLAWVAAKIALGFTLPQIKNRVTRVTQACFEPALDYCVVKAPRWDLAKFKNVERRIGSEMKSVGEVMSIGRSFEEALQKALRMTGTGAPGLTGEDKFSGLVTHTRREIREALRRPTDRRVFVIYRALQEGWTTSDICRETGIDRWFLEKMARVRDTENALAAGPLDPALLKHAKQRGFSDARIAALTGTGEAAVRKQRLEHKIVPAVKQIDTLAAEYPAKTNYLYMTYNGISGGGGNDVQPSERGVCVLGSGAYRIGSSVEFDWCCVNAVETARKLKRHTIMVNCNPETVSTDYDMCDRLYFEELSLERVLDIWEAERPDGVILSMGGQIPNNMAMDLAAQGVPIYGTDPRSIDKAEDRNKFSGLLDVLHIEQPAWTELFNREGKGAREGARAFAHKVGYPVLIRPSYVLSGAAMNVAWDDASLDRFLSLAAEVSAEHPVVISKFVENSKEIEIDAVSKDGQVLYSAITEHIENAGVHSGDATVTLPAQRLYIETIRNVRRTAEKISLALNITGPFNIQFLAQHGRISVIECNLRASRSFPFCSKVTRVNMIELAVRAMLGEPVTKPDVSSLDLGWVGVKAAQFSYSRLHGADPVSGVEMASTGEVGCIGENLHDAFLKALLSVGYQIPKKNILLSTGTLEEKLDFVEPARKLTRMGYTLFASKGTAEFLRKRGVKVTPLFWPLEPKEPNIAGAIRNREIDLIINIPKNNGERELKNDFLIRRMAVDFDIPLFTNVKCAKEFVDALSYYKSQQLGHNQPGHYPLEIKSWEEYR